MNSRKIQAAVCRGFGAPLSIEMVSLAAPGPGEVMVDLAASAVCHSDILYLDGGWGGALPTVFGHEAAGVISALGEDVPDLAVGDHVVVTLIRSCGSCRSCSRNASTCTTPFRLDSHTPLHDESGEPLGQGLKTAAFAEAVVVHRSQLAPIPKEIPFPAASLLACGVITGYGAVTNTASVEPGASALVVGAGGVGLNVVQGAVRSGARPIIVADLVEDKLAMARGLGATHTINLSTGAPDGNILREAVADITDGAMMDYVFVAVGVKAAIDGSADLLAPNGALVLVGIPPSGVTTEIDPVALASSNQRILGSKMGGARVDVDVPDLAARYMNGELELDALITNTYRLEQIDEAIASVKRGEAIRNVIVF